MITVLLITILIIVVFAAVSLLKSYRHVPLVEIKRRAQKGDALAKTMYRAMTYGTSLTVLLWTIVGIATTALFFGLIRHLPWPLASLGIVVVLIAAFAWLPNTRTGWLGEAIVRFCTPSISWLLNYLHPWLEKLGLFIGRFSEPYWHTRLYQKEDLINLLKQQEKQSDNRITKEEIEMAVHALSFGDTLIRNIVIPRSQVVYVNIKDPIGPVLMDTLHKSGHSRFPVFEGKKDTIAGVLYLHDLVAKQASGTVANIMQREVYYVHEEQTLYEALQAFLKTKRHLFVVVNSFEEVVGIITIEDVLEQIIGKPIIDEFDKYEDIRAVAAQNAIQVHEAQKHDGLPPAPEAESAESQ